MARASFLVFVLTSALAAACAVANAQDQGRAKICHGAVGKTGQTIAIGKCFFRADTAVGRELSGACPPGSTCRVLAYTRDTSAGSEILRAALAMTDPLPPPPAPVGVAPSPAIAAPVPLAPLAAVAVAAVPEQPMTTPEPQPDPDAREIGFRTPSNNIHCQLFNPGNDEPPALRCDIARMDNRPPPRPAGCDLDWGQAFELDAADNRGRRICHGDTVQSRTLPVLRYGSRWAEAGINCVSDSSGIICRNRKGAGFKLSRGSQVLIER